MIEKAMWNIMFATYIGCQEGNQNSGKYVSIPILNVYGNKKQVKETGISCPRWRHW